MSGRFQRRGAVVAVVITALSVSPAGAQEKPEPGSDAPPPPILTPPSPRPGPPPAPAPARPSVTNVAWLRQTPAEFPAAAHANRVASGTANLRCMATEGGTLSECVVLRETPEGQGFGEAALAATRSSRVAPRTENGVAVASEVRFTVAFILPAEALDTAPATPRAPGSPDVVKDIVPVPAPSGD
jgi:TonB family protein